MKTYQVKKIDQNTFGIYETNTDQVIMTKKSYREARRIANDMISGRGFAGFTPAFMMNNTPLRSKTA